jgi:signal transduction histidine kinase
MTWVVARAGRAGVLTALVCALWVAALTPGGPPARIAWALAFGAAVLPLRSRPVLVAAAVLGLDVLQTLLGIASESPGSLAPSLAAVYAVGRYAPARARALVLLAYVLYISGADEWSVANVIFGTILFGGTLLFGSLVARRTAGARTAEQILAEESALDPAAVALAVVAEERQRLVVEVVQTVRCAVTEMVDLAAPCDGGGVEPLEEVQRRGRQAIAELRRLLGLLRDEHVATARPQGVRSGRRSGLVDAATAIVLGVLLVAETRAWSEGLGGSSVALTLVVMSASAVRRSHPVPACGVAATAASAAVLVGVPLVPGIGLGIISALLAWSAAGEGTRAAWAALGAFTVAQLVEVHRDWPGNEAMSMAVIALGALSGHLWAERSRMESRALAEVQRLRTESDEVVRAAVREERLRVARELHDVASHAVGVMVLQAGAAVAQWDRDPVAALRARAEAHAAGTAALAELDSLARVLDPPGARPDSAREHAVDALADLTVLVARLRAAGVAVDVSIDRGLLTRLDPSGPESRTVHRVAQEALTNAVRHAPGAHVTVTVRAEGDSIVVEVLDRGGSATPRPQLDMDSGFGLVGIAERVRALGGEASAGPREAGGFAVRARFPLSTGQAAPAPEAAG